MKMTEQWDPPAERSWKNWGLFTQRQELPSLGFLLIWLRSNSFTALPSSFVRRRKKAHATRIWAQRKHQRGRLEDLFWCTLTSSVHTVNSGLGNSEQPGLKCRLYIILCERLQVSGVLRWHFIVRINSVPLWAISAPHPSHIHPHCPPPQVLTSGSLS